MEIIESNKGKDKLAFNGYMYVMKHAGKNYYTWRCNKKSSLNCPAILHTSINTTDPILKVQHQHPAEQSKIEIAKAINKIKQNAKCSGANPSQMYAEAVSQLDVYTKARMPVENSLKRTIRNYRKKKNPIDPASLEELQILGEWCYTGGLQNKLLLLDDNRLEGNERIIMFATHEGLVNLTKSLRWYMDGNFALAPKLFSQLYVIRVEINKNFTTAVYILLQNKTLSTYEMMLTTLLKKCEEQNLYPDPAVVHVDFERAVITAITHVLGQHVHIQGCFYHLTQSTYRKVQELGLQTQYRENQNLIEFCGKMDGLAFLPIGDVKDGMAYLKNIVPEEAESLLNYFDETYVNGKYRQVKNENNKIVLRNCPPIFPPNLWNVNESTLNDEERTNNSTEGWNLRFSKLVGQTHPTIWTIINKIRLEVASDETKLAQIELGVPQQKRQNTVYKKLQIQLKKLCEDYNKGTRDIENFLTAISYTIRYR